jgi:hypothetical protein
LRAGLSVAKNRHRRHQIRPRSENGAPLRICPGIVLASRGNPLVSSVAAHWGGPHKLDQNRPLLRESLREQNLDIVLLGGSGPDLNLEKLGRTRELMNAAIRDVLVDNYQELIDGLTLPDPNDRHVLAAAIRCDAQVIVTWKLRSSPPPTTIAVSGGGSLPSRRLASSPRHRGRLLHRARPAWGGTPPGGHLQLSAGCMARPAAAARRGRPTGPQAGPQAEQGRQGPPHRAAAAAHRPARARKPDPELNRAGHDNP